MPAVPSGPQSPAKNVPGNPSVQPPANPPSGPITYPPFAPPPPSGSSGPEGSQQGPILTPYGGIYPQPMTPGGYSPQQAAGILGESSIAWRPLQQVNIAVLSFYACISGSQTYAQTERFPFPFTIRDMLIFFDGPNSDGNLQFGTSNDNLSAAILNTNGQQSNLILPQSRNSGGVALGCVIAMTPVIPIYNLGYHVSEPNSFIWAYFFNGDSSTRNAQIVATIEIAPGSEAIP